MHNAFFPEEELWRYGEAGWDLSDLKEVTIDQFLEFTTDRAAEGLIRIAGTDGLPAWSVIPPPTEAELKDAAQVEMNALRAQADFIIGPLKDALDGGYISDADKDKLVSWQKYRYELTQVDVGNPAWPAKPV